MKLLWTLLWLLAIFFVGWWIAGVCANLYILLCPFAVFITPLKELTEILHKGLQIPYDWAQNAKAGKSML